MRKTLLLTATAAVALAGTAAQAQEREQISIVGSSTVYPFATMAIENFSEKTDYATPVIESTGSGGGLQIFCEGVGVDTPDITNASRRIKMSEFERCQENGVTDITEVLIGGDGLTIANSVDGPKVSMSLATFGKALRQHVMVDGERVENPYQTWSDIDSSLPDQEITVYGPPPTSGTRDVMNERMVAAGCELDSEDACQTVREDDAFIEAGENDNAIVQRLENNPSAFGAFGFSFLNENRDVIQAVAFDGVEPSFETIASGAYPVTRSMYFYIKNDHIGVVPGIKDYVREFLSDDAMGRRGYMTAGGLVPPQPEMREAILQLAENEHPLTKFDLMAN